MYISLVYTVYVVIKLFIHIAPFFIFKIHSAVSKKYSNMCLTSSSHQHKRRLPPSVFLVIIFNFHTPASNHAIPFLSSIEHRSTYDVLPQRKYTYWCELLIDDGMDESYVPVSILPVSHAALFGIKCPKFRDGVTVGRKVQTLQDKNKTITLSPKVGNQIPSDKGSHLKTDTSIYNAVTTDPGLQII
jgi:hypothetical protein